jgi:hypothetical protein
MTTTNGSVLPISNNHIDHKEPPDLIEVPPEVLSKIENNDQSPTIFNKCWKWMKIFAKKFHGLHEQRPKRLPWPEYIWSFIGAFFGIAAVAFLHYRVLSQ